MSKKLYRFDRILLIFVFLVYSHLTVAGEIHESIRERNMEKIQTLVKSKPMTPKRKASISQQIKERVTLWNSIIVKCFDSCRTDFVLKPLKTNLSMPFLACRLRVFHIDTFENF